MTYCYRPLEAGALDSSLRGQRFMVSTLESLNDGTVGTQVFGVTLDDVKALRIRVDGAWRDLDVRNSSFYLDLPTSGLGSIGSMRVAGARRGARGLAGSTVARLPARADSRRRRTHDQQRMHPAEDAYRRYRYRIYRFFLVRTGSHHDAEDLTQRVFVDALTALSSADTTPDSVLYWLYAVAQRRLVDEFRRRGRSVDDAVPAPQPEAAYGAEVSRSLTAALATLTPEQRTVVVLRLLRGLSFPEIAEVLEVSEDACKMRFSRALVNVRAELQVWRQTAG